jgi:hypothetical protein
MTHRISYRRHLAGAMTVAAALMVDAPMATAQSPQPQSRIAAGIDEAVKALDASPRAKKLSQQAKKDLVEFVIGNTLFVMAHELGHALMYEMSMPVLGREEDAADSFAVVTALNMHRRARGKSNCPGLSSADAAALVLRMNPITSSPSSSSSPS